MLRSFLGGTTTSSAAKWTYIGNCTGYSGEGTSELIFTCGTAKVSDIENVAGTFRRKNITCDTMWADIEWYKEYSTPRAWNPANFPDPQTMLNDLTAQDFQQLGSFIMNPAVLMTLSGSIPVACKGQAII